MATNINLSQSSKKDGLDGQEGSSSKGVIIATLLVILVVGALIGLKIYNGKLRDEISGMSSVIREKTMSFGSEDVNEVEDTYQRINAIKSDINKNIDHVGVLANVEDMILKNIALDSYKYDGIENKLFLTAKSRTGSYQELAQQILTFKSSDFFSDVRVGEIGSEVDSGGNVSVGFSLDMKVAEKSKQ